MSMETRLRAIEAALVGRLGQRVVSFTHFGDDAALAAHEAAVAALEADGYEVLNIVRGPVSAALATGCVVIQRSYGGSR